MLLYLLLTGHTPNKSGELRSNGRLKTQAFLNVKEADFAEVENKVARDLLRGMLDSNPSKRPSATECLSHEFLSQKEEPGRELDLRDVVDKLRRFEVENTLERFVLMYTYHNLATIQEKEEYLTEFKKIDLNSDGFVTHEELTKALVSLGIGQQEAEEESTKIFHVLDKNYNGVIDYSEYVTATIMSERYVTPANLESMFRLLDSGGKGFLRLNEIAKVLDRRQMEKFTKGFQELSPTNRVKGVNIQQFKSIMMLMISESRHSELHY